MAESRDVHHIHRRALHQNSSDDRSHRIRSHSLLLFAFQHRLPQPLPLRLSNLFHCRRRMNPHSQVWYVDRERSRERTCHLTIAGEQERPYHSYRSLCLPQGWYCYCYCCSRHHRFQLDPLAYRLDPHWEYIRWAEVCRHMYMECWAQTCPAAACLSSGPLVLLYLNYHALLPDQSLAMNLAIHIAYHEGVAKGE